MHYVHNIDPIAFWISDIPFAWYWLSYILGFIFVCLWGRHLVIKHQCPLTLNNFWHQLQWAWPALFIGARLVYILFYNLSFFIEHPHLIHQIWLGGMSFHGALIGVLISGLIVARIQKSSFLSFSDIVVTAAPLGIFFGRITNFINGELAGKVSNVPWAVIFPRLYDELPRHPSQLYQAFTEGLLLFIILNILAKKNLNTPGAQSVLFLFGYGILRFLVEFFRLPDPQLGTFAGLSMGQYLCLAMILAAILLMKLKRIQITFR